MSQFTLTLEEDAIMLSALRSKAASYLATYGSFDVELEALIDKVEGQLPAPVIEAAVVAPEPVVETPPDVVEPTEAEIEAHFAEEEAPARKKKAK
jgi:hypothetical protein